MVFRTPTLSHEELMFKALEILYALAKFPSASSVIRKDMIFLRIDLYEFFQFFSVFRVFRAEGVVFDALFRPYAKMVIALEIAYPLVFV